MANFNLQDYVTVAERLAQAKDDIRTIHTDAPVMITEAMGYMRSTVILKDDRTATGTASFRFDLPNQRSAQATNPLEDCETSAIGRALGFLGYGSSKGVASREEVQEAMVRREQPASFQPRQQAQPASNGHANGGKASDKQIKMLFAIWNKAGFEGNLKDWIATTYGCGLDDISIKQASEAIETLQQPA